MIWLIRGLFVVNINTESWGNEKRARLYCKVLSSQWPSHTGITWGALKKMHMLDPRLVPLGTIWATGLLKAPWVILIQSEVEKHCSRLLKEAGISSKDNKNI